VTVRDMRPPTPPEKCKVSESRLFHDVVHERHSVRSFHAEPVPDALLRSVLEDAQRAPSNCNTQRGRPTSCRAHSAIR